MNIFVIQLFSPNERVVHSPIVFRDVSKGEKRLVEIVNQEFNQYFCSVQDAKKFLHDGSFEFLILYWYLETEDLGLTYEMLHPSVN